MLFVDLTDLVSNCLWYDSFTGIQRVQLTTAYLLASDADCNCFSIFEGDWRNLNEIIRSSTGDADKFTALIRSEFENEVRMRSWSGYAKFLYILRRRALRPFFTVRGKASIRRHIKRNDAVVAMGCYWQVSYLIDFYEYVQKIGARFVCLTHDIFPLKSKTNHGNASLIPFMKRFLSLNATHIVNSNFTKDELDQAHKMGIVQLKNTEICVVPLAQQYFGADRNAILPRPNRLISAIGNKPYVLLVGTGPRKNHNLALRAWRILKNVHDDSLPNLVFTGSHTDADPVDNTINAVVFERPTDQELSALYSNCLFTFFPSIEEGWGLPVGESLWFGKLCVSSNGGSLIEAGNQDVIYFDPFSVSDCVRALSVALDDDRRISIEKSIEICQLRIWTEVGSDMKDSILSIFSRFHE